MSKAVMSLTTGLEDPENVTIVVASWRNHAGEAVDRRRSGNHIQLLTKEVTVVTNLGEEFAHALAAKDSARMAKLFADRIDFQALTPGRHWQASTPEEAVGDIILGTWFGPQDDIHELRSVTCGQVSDRESVSYRLGVKRNDEEYVVEQHAYYESDGTHITWIRMLCSGYRPESPE